MAEEPAQNETCVVEMLEPEYKRVRLVGKRRLQAPKARPATKRFILERAADGPPTLRPVTEEVMECQGAQGGEVLFVIVDTSPHEVELAFSGVARDEKGHPFDLVLNCSYSIKRLEVFVTEVALHHSSPSRPLTVQRGKVWIENAIRGSLKDELKRHWERGHTLEVTIEKDIIASSWWEKKLNLWLEGHGIAVKVEAYRWENLDAARAEAERTNQRTMEHELKAREREREFELVSAQEEAEHQEKIKQIQAGQEDTAARRRFEEEKARLGREFELEKRRELLADMKAKREAHALEMDAAKARDNQQEDQAQELERIRQELLAKHAREMKELKVHLANELARQFKERPNTLELLEEDARQTQEAPEPEPAKSGREVPPPEKRKSRVADEVTKPAQPGHDRTKKVEALRQAREKKRAEEANRLMERLGQVYREADQASKALEKLKDEVIELPVPPSAAGKAPQKDVTPTEDRPEPVFDFDRMSEMFLGAVVRERATKKQTRKRDKEAKAREKKGKKEQEEKRDRMKGLRAHFDEILTQSAETARNRPRQATSEVRIEFPGLPKAGTATKTGPSKGEPDETSTRGEDYASNFEQAYKSSQAPSKKPERDVKAAEENGRPDANERPAQAFRPPGVKPRTEKKAPKDKVRAKDDTAKSKDAPTDKAPAKSTEPPKKKAAKKTGLGAFTADRKTVKKTAPKAKRKPKKKMKSFSFDPREKKPPT